MTDPTNQHQEQAREPELLPCPFCGGKAAWGEGEQKTKYGNEQVYCIDCWAITAPEGTKAEAAENWNTRVVNLNRSNYRFAENWIYEDDLPVDITKVMYDQWYKRSRIVDGVRMGPSIEQESQLP